MNNEIHPYDSSPLRNQHDYGEKTASQCNIAFFSENANKIIEKLQDFQYGCVYTDGKILTSLNDIDKEDGANIYIQSPLEFWNNKIGMCHDASILIDVMLTKENINHICCFIYSDEPPFYPTHSFIVALCNDNKHRIIDVFATKQCVYEESFKEVNEAADYRFKQWIKTDNNNKNNAHLLIGEHMPYPKCDFMNYYSKIKKSMI
jgi:hypothetical protein